MIRALQTVCKRMLQREAAFVSQPDASAPAGAGEQPHFFGSVGFVGQIDGIVYLCIPDDFAREAAAHLLGLSPAEVADSSDDTVKDVVGEITNMTVGAFKNALCDLGLPCKLTLPTILRGDRLAVSCLKGATRHAFHFDCAGHRLVVDVQLKQE